MITPSSRGFFMFRKCPDIVDRGNTAGGNDAKSGAVDHLLQSPERFGPTSTPSRAISV